MTEIALCFFGITRSLRHTIASIEQNVLTPARHVGNVKVFAHFFEQTQALGPGGAQEGHFDVADARLLAPDWLETEPPETCLEVWDFERIRTFGDAWDDDFRSARNLMHALHSLNAVTTRALAEAPDIVGLFRPDLKYHDSLGPAFDAAASGDARLLLPGWQSWGGLNDRFAIARGTKPAAAYGQRAAQALAFCQATNGPLHAERLVKFAVEQDRVATETIPQRASRIRASGGKIWENFGDERANIRHAVWKRRLWRLAEATGVKSAARAVRKSLGR